MKMKNLDKKKFQLRLAYVSDYWNSSWIDDPEREKNLTQRIIDVKDNFSWCFLAFQDLVLMKLIINWFHKHDINETKNYAYNYAKLQYVMSQSPYDYLGQESCL